MSTYLASYHFKDLPFIEKKRIGWDDEKGEELKKVALTGCEHYAENMRVASTYADAFAKKILEVDKFLSCNEPTLKSL